MDHIQQLVHKFEDRILSFYIIADLLYTFVPDNVNELRFLAALLKKVQFMFWVKKIPLPWLLASGFTIKVFEILCFFI